MVPYFGEHVIWLCIQLPYNNKGGVYHWGEGVAAELGLSRPALLSKEYSVSRWCLLLLYQACVCNAGSADPLQVGRQGVWGLFFVCCLYSMDVKNLQKSRTRSRLVGESAPASS